MLRTLLVACLLGSALADGHGSHMTYYASADGTGSDCTMEMMCPLSTAINKAAEGDKVMAAAGKYTGNYMISKAITLEGMGMDTMLVSGNDLNSNNQDIVLMISAAATVKKLKVMHDGMEAMGRDIGIMINGMASGAMIMEVGVERNSSRTQEPVMPGSRGILVYMAKMVTIKDSMFMGPYEDHIHLPTMNTTVMNNTVMDATRLGIVVIQETEETDNSGHMIEMNMVTGSGSDGIQIQGENCTVKMNTIHSSGGYGIHICGNMTEEFCVAPGVNSTAMGAMVEGNIFANAMTMRTNKLGNIGNGAMADVICASKYMKDGMDCVYSSATSLTGMGLALFTSALVALHLF